MQTLYYQTEHYMCHRGNIVDLEEYRRRLAGAAQPSAGLPPRPRREHRCPLGVRLSDLISMGVVAATLAMTGAAVAAMF